MDAAPAGAKIRVPPGVYRGPFRIDKPITLEGVGSPVLDGQGAGNVVEVAAPDVAIHGFIIRNTGDSLDRENAGVTVNKAPRCAVEHNVFENVLFGVYMKESPGSVVRGNAIGAKDLSPARRGDGVRLWRCDDSLVEGNVVQSGRDVVLWFCDRLTVRGNTIRGGRYGLHFMYSDSNVIEENRLERNSVGAFLMYSHNLTLRRNLFAGNRGPSGYGVGLKDMDGVIATQNRFVGNRVGLHLDDSPSSMDAIGVFNENVFAYNDIGVAWLPNVARNHFAQNAFVDNIEQLAILGSGAGDGNSFTVDGVGNYWSDYAGFDLDGDGVGDIPHTVRSYFEDLLDRNPLLRLFLMSPAEQAIETAVRSFPVVAPRVKAVDSAPMLAAVIPPAPALRSSRGAGPTLVAAGLAGLAVMALLGAAFVSGSPPRRGKTSATRPAKAPDTDALRVTTLSKRYGRAVVVDGVSFRVAPGEAVALWGPNGAGKTTILRCILGLTRSRGGIDVMGARVRGNGRAARRLMGYVPQESALFNDLTVSQTMALFARLRRTPRELILAALAEVDLAAQGRKRVSTLSGGMKRRLALAIALLGDPPLLLLDEPTANLDAEGRDAFLRLLRGLIDRGKTALFSTHRASDVAQLADRVLEIREGRMAGERQPHDLAHAGRPDGLRLAVAREHLEKALAALRTHGVDATSREGAIHVAASSGSRVEPLRLLFEAGVRVDDLALLWADRNGDEGRQP